MEQKQTPTAATVSEYEKMNQAIQVDTNVEIPEENINKFPVNVFPKEMQKYIDDAFNILHFSKEFLSASMLVTLGIAIGKTRIIKVGTDWSYKPILFMMIIAPPGSCKSPIIQYAMKPLTQLNTEMLTESSNNDQELRQILIDDITPEALIETHSMNPFRLGFYVDELSGLFEQLNRYNNSNSNEQLLFNLYGGKSIVVNRKTTNKKRIFLKETCVSIIGSIQPEIFLKLFGTKYIKNGLFYRFLQVRGECPTPFLPTEDFPEENIKWWNELIHKMITKLDKEYDVYDVASEYHFCEEGNNYYHSWQALHINKAMDDNNDQFKELIMKIQEYVPKFALILHTLNEFCGGPNDTEITFLETCQACLIADYFYECGVQSLNALNENTVEGEKKQKELFNNLPECFKAKEAEEWATVLKISRATLYRYLGKFIKEGKLTRDFRRIYTKTGLI